MDNHEAHFQLIEWLLGGGTALIGALIGIVVWFYQRALEDIRNRQDKADEKLDNSIALINAEHRQTELRLADDIKLQTSRTNDINATVSGFGGSFLPRREWEVERERLERRGESKRG